MQRKELNEQETTADDELESYVENLNSSGQALPDEVRSFYEPRLGYDFRNVKVHNDAVAAKSAQSINALAYTSGNNIIFNEGEYAPDAYDGKELLAHELTHVVQQGANNSLISRFWDEEELSDESGSWFDTAVEAAGDAGSWVSQTASDAGEWVGETVSDNGSLLGETAGDVASWVGETAGDAGEWLGGPQVSGDEGQGNFGDLIEHPEVADYCVHHPKCMSALWECLIWGIPGGAIGAVSGAVGGAFGGPLALLTGVVGGLGGFAAGCLSGALDAVKDDVLPIKGPPAQKGLADVAKRVADHTPRPQAEPDPDFPLLP